MIQFPHNFLWGAATSAYQVEGNNLNCDWWEWEKRIGLKEASGLACRHYDFYKQDFNLAKELRHNAHRLSIEWSRIEPQEGRFSEGEIDHYREVLSYLRQLGIEPIVTLHHFTNPLWFAGLGGWQKQKSSDYFLRYVQKIVDAFCDKVRYWITINEPNVYTYHSYILGLWPPQEKSLQKARQVSKNLFISHIKAYNCIHAIYKKRNLNRPLVSIAHNLQAFEYCSPSLKNKISVYLRDKLYNFDFIRGLIKANALDCIGVNYYSRSLIDADNWSLNNLLLETCKKNHSSLKKNSMGWDIYPQGLYNLLLRLKKFNLPILISENGISTDDDNQRRDFIREHLKKISLAIGKGANILGYIYWSLMDNYEWDKGFSPRFGLIEIDYNTYQRIVRDSAKDFSLVCKTGELQVINE